MLQCTLPHGAPAAYPASGRLPSLSTLQPRVRPYRQLWRGFRLPYLPLVHLEAGNAVYVPASFISLYLRSGDARRRIFLFFLISLLAKAVKDENKI